MDQHSHQPTDMFSSASSSTPETISALSDPPSDSITNQAPDETNGASDSDIPRQQPIPPASEPMQYRAIGLLRGQYVASEEQFTRGHMLTEEGLAIDAVLLGRVMSLVKKHLDLEQPHLWVVYPRTRNKDNLLHVQIVGVWEPENLNRDYLNAQAMHDDGDEEHEDLDGAESFEDEEMDETVSEEAIAQDDHPVAPSDVAESGSDADDLSDLSEPEVSTTSEAEDAAAQAAETAAAHEARLLAKPQRMVSPPERAPEVIKIEPAKPATPKIQDGYFSVRGEIIKQSLEENEIKVKIRQAPKRGTTQEKTFNLTLRGTLEGKAVGYFWDLNVLRQGSDLVVESGDMIGLVPPTKRGKTGGRRNGPPNNRRGPFKGGKPGGRPSGPNKRYRNGSREGYQGSDRPAPPSGGRGAAARPVKRRHDDSKSTPE